MEKEWEAVERRVDWKLGSQCVCREEATLKKALFAKWLCCLAAAACARLNALSTGDPHAWHKSFKEEVAVRKRVSAFPARLSDAKVGPRDITAMSEEELILASNYRHEGTNR